MRIHHIALSVKDSEKTVEFYKENFGFRELRRFTKPSWDGEAAIIALEDMQLEIFQFRNKSGKKDDLMDLHVVGLKHIGIEVQNVREKFLELKKKGIDIDEPIKGTTCAWFCFLRDPDGIPIELYEPG